MGKGAIFLRSFLLLLVIGAFGTPARAALPGAPAQLPPPPLPLPNRAPELMVIGNRTGSEGAPLIFTVAATDADLNVLTFSASGLPLGARFDPVLRVFSWTPGFNQAGSYPGVTFRVSDGTATDSEAITITITNTNRAPELAVIGNTAGSEGAPLTFTVAAADADLNVLTFSASGLPLGARFDPVLRTFSWTPGFNQAGSYPVTLSVSDGTATDSEAITITIINTNRAPELTVIGNTAGSEGAPLTFTVAATDADLDVLTFSASGLPLGARFDPVLRTFSWTPGFNQAGSYPGVTLSVSDGTATDSEAITITVADTITDPAPLLAKLDPLLQRRASNLSGYSQVVVRAQNAAALDPVALLIQELGGTLGLRLPIIDAQAADVPNTALLVLADSPNVKRMALDRLILGSTERTGATVGATAARQALGYDGAGIGVAVIDSGVTLWHDDLTKAGSPGSQRVDGFVDFVTGHATPYDDFGHGTHVAGIIAGNGFDSGGARSGISPAARLLVLKVLDGSGRGRISNAIGAIDYVINHQALFNIRVINLSIGAGVYESYDSDFLTLAAKRAVEQGIVVVAAAGNLGKDAQGRRQYGSITAPGNAPWVLTVGASSHMGTSARADDTIAAFSSRGPTAVDNTAKPDVVAPGVGIESLSDPSSLFYASKSPYLLSGTVATPYLPYLSLSGTSQAAPVVAGTVALMLQANPALTPNAVKAILQYTAQSYNGYDALTQGTGFLNARGAIELARFFRDPLGQYPFEPEWGRQLIWGNHRVQGGRLVPSANGWSNNVVWGSPATADGQPVAWGFICTGPNCETSWDAWTTWGTTCSDAQCTTSVWSAESSENVVWGSTCGGADCADATWSTSLDDDTVVWGNSLDDDTVVWGNSDDDTVVWGNTDDDADVVW